MDGVLLVQEEIKGFKTQRPSGTLHFKGVNIGAAHAKKLMDQRTGIVDVRVAWNRWLALKKDGTVISTGFEQPPNLRPAVGIAMGPHTDIVFHVDGTITSWGREELAVPADLGPVRDFGVGEKAGIAALPDGTAFPELVEVSDSFDENVIDVSMGSSTTNGLVRWIVRDN